jgi:hypothetical protein
LRKTRLSRAEKTVCRMWLRRIYNHKEIFVADEDASKATYSLKPFSILIKE